MLARRRLPPGRRGLKQHWGGVMAFQPVRRLPPGRRGLKLCKRIQKEIDNMSPSPRKAWIETFCNSFDDSVEDRRLPPGRRGLKRSLYADLGLPT